MTMELLGSIKRRSAEKQQHRGDPWEVLLSINGIVRVELMHRYGVDNQR